MNKRYISLLSMMVVGMYVYYAYYAPPSSSIDIKVRHSSPTVKANDHSNGVLPIPDNFDELIAKRDNDTLVIPLSDNNLLVSNPFHDDNESPSLMESSQSLAIDSNINLLTGSDLWIYLPNLKEQIELEQQIFLPSDSTIIQVDTTLLKQLAIGDSLILSLPDKGKQQIIIASIQRKKNDIVVWELQNTQRQDIGKITQIKAITEGSFITDDKQEYHLRTIKNKGWIASKDQLIDNNNQAINKNRQQFSEKFLNIK
ncbi:hypothetical protein [Photobacterium kishitanii]|uniref:hypothetical protein n=1 Tax=Photobacterium kishitanii TaxID=318456 RepID=UPI00069746A5|nr:hypothetical protein [Photobacterium kishitanii]OBU32129.1 hypothetical protein AYY23_03165 [Photobacterium kishitanii]PSV04637.1 hypothetical protein C0W96_16565 [Photobacterium kishitanii]PSV77848.1 hypothetical protein C0W29_00555 [Photobacterium kishitanii]PSW50462.1 hypothetical protein C0W66_06120 [Photobacterium kishitanii]